MVTKIPPELHAFCGHTDTVPDIVGRFGMPGFARMRDDEYGAPMSLN